MLINIEYDSCWQNSVLSGTNDKPLPLKGRDFVATSEGLKIERKEITKNTVLGILCRLIGDQRKLYQARVSDNYVFKDMEDAISFSTPVNKVWQEVVYIRNTKTNTNPRHSVSGVIRNDTKLFFSEYSAQLWSILFLDFKTILDFVVTDDVHKAIHYNISPSQIVLRIQEIQSFEKYVFLRTRVSKLKEKLNKIGDTLVKLSDEMKSADDKSKKKIDKKQSKLNNDIVKIEKEVTQLETNKIEINLQNTIDKAVKKLSDEFPKDGNEQPHVKNGAVFPISVYASALYIQLQRMEKQNIDISELKSDKGKIQGFSNWGFNGIRDLLYKFSTGGKARNQGNPYKDKNGQALTKASGVLEINIDVKREKAKEIKKLIENAGVSSFYLGKKGLAYVTNIDTRELRR